jgi:hypothetical protein
METLTYINTWVRTLFYTTGNSSPTILAKWRFQNLPKRRNPQNWRESQISPPSRLPTCDEWVGQSVGTYIDAPQSLQSFLVSREICNAKCAGTMKQGQRGGEGIAHDPYLSFIQHVQYILYVVCIPGVCWFNMVRHRNWFQGPQISVGRVIWEELATNWKRGVEFVCWMDERCIYMRWFYFHLVLVVNVGRFSPIRVATLLGS